MFIYSQICECVFHPSWRTDWHLSKNLISQMFDLILVSTIRKTATNSISCRFFDLIIKSKMSTYQAQILSTTIPDETNRTILMRYNYLPQEGSVKIETSRSGKKVYALRKRAMINYSETKRRTVSGCILDRRSYLPN